MRTKTSRVLFAGAALLCLSAQTQASTIVSVSGTVRVKDKAGYIAVSESSRMPYALSPGQHLETDSSARARILLDDQSEITMGSGSEFIVPEPGAAEQSRSIPQVLYGLFRVFVRKHASTTEEWRIQSGSAVMGVRGTDFVIDSSRDRTMMCTFSGAVDIRSTQDPSRVRRVRANEGVVVSSEGRVSPPVAMDGRQMDWWREETSVGAPRARDVPLRTVGEQWQWDGPAAVDSLDPNALYSQFSMLALHPTLWGFSSQTENAGTLGHGASHSDANLTLRGILDGLFVPNRGVLFFVEPSAAMKSGHANTDNSGFHLNQAFATIRIESTHSFTFGRQEWQFGDGLLIGREPWQPFTRNYDGALATLRWAPLKLRVFGSTLEDRTNKADINDWLAGAWADFSKFPLALYALWVTRDGTDNNIATSNDIQARYGIFGERGNFTIERWGFVDEEFDYEAGRIGTPGLNTETVSSYLGYLDAGVGFDVGHTATVLKAVYIAASGDRNPGSGTYTAFVPLLNDSHRFLGLVNAFPQLRNIQRAGATLAAQRPIASHPFAAQLDYSHFMRMTTSDLVYPAVTSTGLSTLGDELDLQLSYEALAPLNVHVGGGYLIQGAAYGSNQPAAYLAFLSAELHL